MREGAYYVRCECFVCELFFMNPIALNILGYTASVLIAVSLMMSAVIKLRIINLIGASSFAIYGAMIGALPVMIMNSVIVVINIFHLYRIFTTKEYFKLLQVPPDSPYLLHFLHFYEKQIRKFQPTFNFEQRPDWLPIFILRDTVPAGLVLGVHTTTDRFRILLDFAIPKFRDFKIARYLFGAKRSFFTEQGIRYIESVRGNEVHDKYLERMGFAIHPDDPSMYVLDLSPNEDHLNTKGEG